MVFTNNTKRAIEPGQQLYNFYGSRSNLMLMLNYGFALENNVYDSFVFHVNIALTQVHDFDFPSLAMKLPPLQSLSSSNQ